MAKVITWDEVTNEVASHEIELKKDVGTDELAKAITRHLVGGDMEDEDDDWTVVVEWDSGKGVTVQVLVDSEGNQATNQIIW